MACSPPSDDNAAQIEYWNDRAGLTWVKFQERLDAVFEPITTHALSAARPAAGEHAIDIGCGCGATVLALADRVGPTGRVTGLDVSKPMAARAQERIKAAGLTNAEITLADAATYAFPAGAADLMFSRFGIMFFADPVAAFANLRRAMQTDGRLLCAAWRALADNSWFTVPLEAARPFLTPQPPADPEAPGPFALADADRIRRILAGSGWRDVAVTGEEVPIRLGPLEQATEFATHVGALARSLQTEGDEIRARVRQAVAQALARHDGPDGVVLSGAIWLISARAS